MSGSSLQIVRLERRPRYDDSDDLSFAPGVNVIAGEKDAGKTRWLGMLDFLFGDHGTPEEAFTLKLATKYESVAAVVKIDGEELKIERRWKEPGNRTKIFINESAVRAEDFSNIILEKLNIPILRFPRGNPFSDPSWAELSWRMLYRHIYRHENSWDDFASKQPPKEQHACLVQFLGAAQAIYPTQYGELIARQKELSRLQAQKESYASTLQEITTDLLRQKELTVAVTPDAVTMSEQRISAELKKLGEQRRKIIESIEAKQHEGQSALFEILKKQQREVATLREASLGRRSSNEKRLKDLKGYQLVISAEISRLERLKTSGQIFADLKVTQCPVCDQPVTPREGVVCYLCGKAHPSDLQKTSGFNRIQFEEDQLREESTEIGELIAKLNEEQEALEKQLAREEEDLEKLETSLAPAREMAEALMPPDLAVLNTKEGQLREQLAQLRRVRSAIDQQRIIGEQIQHLERIEAGLRSDIEQKTPEANLGDLGQIMQDGMNTYLTFLNVGDPGRWQHGAISFSLRERDFRVKVHNQRWDKECGAASQAILLFAYHYALLNLVSHDRFNYPGLVIVDFPVQLADGTSIADKENYLVEPFIQLCQKIGGERAQFIAAGRAFENLEGAHRIQLPKWTQFELDQKFLDAEEES